MLAFFITLQFSSLLPEAVAGDVFFLSYITASWWLIISATHKDLAARAKIQDEGAVIVVAITLAAIVFTCIGIFVALNHQPQVEPGAFLVSLAGAPLAWFMLHTVMTFHYANLHYACAEKSGHNPGLEFPGTAKPWPWDFAYFSFVIGMTAQTSDIAVKDTDMRRTVTLHAIVSFFFNTVLIAMAVNAGVSHAG